ncbi:MAG TPA: glycoside hydrolase family 32 protein, partial [Clostridia bacterium]|nr:glycoside hydrolase family 32 protein [Clostridia bacterium]
MANPAEMAEITRQFREMLLRDPYRPRYHFAIPDGDGNPGDPNCCFYANGRHHLMYLYRRQGKPFRFGHMSSVDLLHWRHHPDAQGEGLFDNGCFSGGAFVDEDRTAYITYWVVSEGKHKPGTDAGIQLLRGVPPYEVWERLPQVAVPSTEWGIRDVMEPDGSISHLGCADPSNIWKKDGVYYLQTGNLLVLNKYGRAADSPAEFRGDWTELYASTDLTNWVHKGRFYQRRADNAWTDETEDDMCPTFLPLPASKEGGAASGKHLQTFIAHNKGCQYYIGSLCGEFFLPERHGRMSWRDNTYFAPEAYLDSRGRQILFAWLLDNLPDDFRRYGWSGVYALPRVLWLNEQGGLGIAPIPELRALRVNPQDFG